MDMSRSIDFFETQFRSQVTSGDRELNPFEASALPYLQGQVLDFGCGLGNLALAAARRGNSVVALDASATAIWHLSEVSSQEGLALNAIQADLRTYVVTGEFDAVVSIGLLMFFDRTNARQQLAQLRNLVRPRGIAVINVLIQGTSFLDMFDPTEYYLFERGELRESFGGWEIVSETADEFPAPGNTTKLFATVIARKPGS